MLLSSYPSPKVTFWKPVAEQVVKIRRAQIAGPADFFSSMKADDLHQAIRRGGNHLIKVHRQYGFGADHLDLSIQQTINAARIPLNSMEWYRKKIINDEYSSLHAQIVKNAFRKLLDQTENAFTIVKSLANGHFDMEFVNALIQVFIAGFDAFSTYIKQKYELYRTYVFWHEQVISQYQHAINGLNIDFNEFIHPLINKDLNARFMQNSSNPMFLSQHSGFVPILRK